MDINIQELIRDAYVEITKLSADSTIGAVNDISTAEENRAVRKLNGIIGGLNITEVALFNKRPYSFNLKSGQFIYSCGEAEGIDFPMLNVNIAPSLHVISHEQKSYKLNRLEVENFLDDLDHTYFGRPSTFAYNFDKDISSLYFKPIPDANYAITVIVQNIINDDLVASDTLVIPSYYYNLLLYELAYALTGSYNDVVQVTLQANLANARAIVANAKKIVPPIAKYPATSYRGAYRQFVDGY